MKVLVWYDQNDCTFMYTFVYNVSPKRTVWIKDQAARFVQPDLDLHWLRSQLQSSKAL